jgi:hypothetical protein
MDRPNIGDMGTGPSAGWPKDRGSDRPNVLPVLPQRPTGQTRRGEAAGPCQRAGLGRPFAGAAVTIAGFAHSPAKAICGTASAGLQLARRLGSGARLAKATGGLGPSYRGRRESEAQPEPGPAVRVQGFRPDRATPLIGRHWAERRALVASERHHRC